jgi:hypothetical protein
LFSFSTIVVASALPPLTMMWRRMLTHALPQRHQCGRWHRLGRFASALSRPAFSHLRWHSLLLAATTIGHHADLCQRLALIVMAPLRRK